jgi:hypothetical protein
VVKLAGAAAGLERERRHVAVVIPRAVLTSLRQSVTGDPAAFGRFLALVGGVAAATGGFASGRLRLALAGRRRPAA